MKKLLGFFMILILIFSSCNNESETITKNGIPLKDTINFNTTFLGKFELKTYNDKVEVWEVKCDSSTYILSIKSNGVTMIKK